LTTAWYSDGLWKKQQEFCNRIITNQLYDDEILSSVMYQCDSRHVIGQQYVRLTLLQDIKAYEGVVGKLHSLLILALY
jgi:hypothetical protein